MLIQTTRFGEIEVDDTKLITFPDGLLGFPQHRRFALVQTASEPVFFWLQSIESANLAFVVCDPRTFIPDYVAPVRVEEVKSLGITRSEDAQVLVIVNKVDGYLTGNLLGPLVIAADTMTGKQLVLADKRFSTRHPLMQSPAAQQAAGVTQTA